MTAEKHYETISNYIYLLSGREYGAVRYDNPLTQRFRQVWDNKYYITKFPFQPAEGFESEVKDDFEMRRLDFMSASAQMGRITLVVDDRGYTDCVRVKLSDDGKKFVWDSEMAEYRAKRLFGKGISPLGIVRHTEVLLKEVVADFAKEIELVLGTKVADK